MPRAGLVGIVLMVSGLALAGIGVTMLVGTDAAAVPVSVAAPTTGSPATTSTSTTATTAISTTTSTTTTTTTSTPTTLPQAENPEDFLELLVAGLRADPEFLVSRLNEATIAIYGADQCLETFNGVLDPDTTMEIREIGDEGPWEYRVDDIVTPLDEVLFVEVERFVAGQTLIQEVHWKLVDGLWTWFSDCGEPLEASGR